MEKELISQLSYQSSSKIVMLVMDGLGGLPGTAEGKTELEAANSPNMDKLAEKSALGLSVPVRTGITTGSGPGHLGIFGYDPIKYEIGRGALEALGVDFDLKMEDVAARGNFCSVDKNGIITDRRAGRIPTETAIDLIDILSEIKIDDYQFFVLPVKEHRFAFVIRGDGLSDQIAGTDPLVVGEKPLKPRTLHAKAKLTAELIEEYIFKARRLLSSQFPANMLLLRGFAQLPKVPSFQEKYHLNPASIAVNGMYRGVSRLVGMEILDVGGKTIRDEFITLTKFWRNFDFFYVHIKQTDTFGEEGDFEAKVQIIEEVDSLLPEMLDLNPDVVIITGDHSSPASMKSHSWHPVPTLLYSKYVRPDNRSSFCETSCSYGSLGIIPAKKIMHLALANAQKLSKFGA